MVDRPDKVRINSDDYSIIYEGTAWKVSTGLAAQIDYENFVIRVFDTGPGTAIAARLMHEVMHGIIEFQGNSDKMDMVSLEDCCNMSSHGMIDFFRSNPEVLKWWIEQIAGY